MRRKAAAALASVLAMGAVGTWLVGSRLTAPVLRGIGPPPADLRAESVEFGSASGARLRGWYARGEPRAGVIVLMHGVRASRLAMIDRASFLHRAGHAVLLFDFQAHGESVGRRITFGYLESRDAQAAIAFARARATGEKVGIIGVSQGGAAALIASPPLEVDAAVIEQVYSEIDEAIGNRLALHLGGWARVLSPLLSWQLRTRLGVPAAALRPIDGAARLHCAKLFIGGDADAHTTAEQSRALFAAATEPKEIWLLPQARHVDLHRRAAAEYEERVLRFFATTIRHTSE